jgi:uncharacterized protein with PCYCGC motif
MKKRIGTIVFLVAVSAFTLAQWNNPDPFDVPAYHADPPAKNQKLPPILTPAQLALPAGQGVIQDKVYTLAAKIPKVLYQQPCYCHCDRSAGHTSLHSCFSSEHGAHCAACMQEAVLSYQMTKQGKTPAQIRKSIMAGEWQKVDLTKVNEIN